MARLPAGRRLAHAIATRAAGTALPARACRLLAAASSTPEESYARTVSVFTPEEVRRLYSEEMSARTREVTPYAGLRRAFVASDAADLLGRTLHVDTLTYLPDDLLVKVDIATMAHGLEARSPLLDHPLVEFAARLPPEVKMPGGRLKGLFKAAMAPHLPTAIVNRQKMGFSVPIDRWLRHELKDFAHDTLLAPAARQ